MFWIIWVFFCDELNRCLRNIDWFINLHSIIFGFSWILQGPISSWGYNICSYMFCLHLGEVKNKWEDKGRTWITLVDSTNWRKRTEQISRIIRSEESNNKGLVKCFHSNGGWVVVSHYTMYTHVALHLTFDMFTYLTCQLMVHTEIVPRKGSLLKNQS